MWCFERVQCDTSSKVDVHSCLQNPNPEDPHDIDNMPLHSLKASLQCEGVKPGRRGLHQLRELLKSIWYKVESEESEDE